VRRLGWLRWGHHPECWLPNRTGRPKLYIAIGVSGVMHHMVGCRDAKVIAAINSDPEAPVFEVCDVGIVGDYHQVVAHLIKELNRSCVGSSDR
jgi:electron transfer flavoprotein alpha subunit